MNQKVNYVYEMIIVFRVSCQSIF